MDTFIRILARELWALIAALFLVLPVVLIFGSIVFAVLAIFGPKNAFFEALSWVLSPFYGVHGRVKIGVNEVMMIFTAASLVLFAISRFLSLFLQKEIKLPSGYLIIIVTQIISMIAIGIQLQDFISAVRIFSVFMIISLASHAIYRFFMHLSDKAVTADADEPLHNEIGM